MSWTAVEAGVSPARTVEVAVSRLKWRGIRSIVLAVSKVEQMESELRKLSQAELRQIREWLDDFIEDELEFTAEFENSIQRSERDMAAGKAVRVREPKGSWVRRLRFTTRVSMRFSSCCQPLSGHALKRKSTKSDYGSNHIHIIGWKDRIVFRARVGEHRIIYTFDVEQNRIHLLAIGHRREIYRS
jgi:mRNA-degrading endonuclease RelE of RelBE toxin-antitoxin system